MPMLLTDFGTWWEAKDLLEKTYWIVAVPSSLFFLIMLVMTFFGADVSSGDYEFDADAGDIDEVGDDGGIGFQFFTLKNLLAFFAVFSWTGIASTQEGMGTIASIALSVGAGLFTMTIMAVLFYFISKLTHSGTMDLNNAIGAVGDVYLPIKSKRSGTGKIQVTIQGALRTMDAITDDEEDLPSGTLVKVTKIVNETLLLVTRSS